MNKDKAIKDCEIKISDECFKINELCKLFKTAELKKFKGIERYREMLKISTQIATIDERLWSLYDKIPDENKLKKEKIVSVARDEAKQVKEIMENEDDPRKKYIISYSSQQFNTWRLQSTPKISRSASTMHFNQLSATAVGISSECTPRQSKSGQSSVPVLMKSSSSPNLLRGSITDAGRTSNSADFYSDHELSNYFEAETDTSNESIFFTPDVPPRSGREKNTAIEVDGINSNIDIQLKDEMEETEKEEETEEESEEEEEMNSTFLASQSTVQQIESEHDNFLAATDSDNFSQTSTYTEDAINDTSTTPNFDLNESMCSDGKDDEGSIAPTQLLNGGVNSTDSPYIEDIEDDDSHTSITEQMSGVFAVDGAKVSTPISTISQQAPAAGSIIESRNVTINGDDNKTNFYDEMFNYNLIVNDVDEMNESENQKIPMSNVYKSTSNQGRNKLEQEEQYLARSISPQLSLEFLSGSDVKWQENVNRSPAHNLGYLSHSAMYLIQLIGQTRKTTWHIFN